MSFEFEMFLGFLVFEKIPQDHKKLHNPSSSYTVSIHVSNIAEHLVQVLRFFLI